MPVPFLAGAGARAGAMRAGAGRAFAGCTHFRPINEASDEQLAIVSLLEDIAAAQTDANEQWPTGACVETSVAIRDALREKLPATEPAYVYGSFTMGDISIAHAWVVLRDGTIVDGTLGQFARHAPAWRVIPPDNAFADHYRPRGAANVADAPAAEAA